MSGKRYSDEFKIEAVKQVTSLLIVTPISANLTMSCARLTDALYFRTPLSKTFNSRL